MRRNHSLSPGALIRAPSYANGSTIPTSDLSIFLDFLEKPGCHLCEDALPVAARVARRLNLTLRRVDIHSDDELIKEFSFRIPVIRLGSTVIAEGLVEYKPTLAAARAEMRSAATED
jgi:thiol-disulfide isomerase/thioredoxin